MAKEVIVSIERYDLKFGIYQPKQQSRTKKTAEQKETITKSIGNVLVKMFEEQIQGNQKGMMLNE